MSIELKVKNKHLAEEAKIIRFEERKQLNAARYATKKHLNDPGRFYKTYHSLSLHRKWDVRNENRATSIARAYLAGKSYKSVEQTCKDIGKRDYYIVPRALTMINKYGETKISEGDLLIWINLP